MSKGKVFLIHSKNCHHCERLLKTIWSLETSGKNKTATSELQKLSIDVYSACVEIREEVESLPKEFFTLSSFFYPMILFVPEKIWNIKQKTGTFNMKDVFCMNAEYVESSRKYNWSAKYDPFNADSYPRWIEDCEKEMNKKTTDEPLLEPEKPLNNSSTSSEKNSGESFSFCRGMKVCTVRR